MMLMRSEGNNPLQWLDVLDDRFEWLNVADWEPQNGGLQPVRVPKFWRDQWPSRTARRKPVAIKMARDPIFIATALPVSYAGGNNQI